MMLARLTGLPPEAPASSRAVAVNGYGITPAERASLTAPASTKCYYVLDVLLSD